jgi:hypothetical protein
MPYLDHISEENFESNALAVFERQYARNLRYRKWCDLLHRNPKNVHSLEGIPFLPVEQFKEQEIKTGDWKSEAVFSSSTTTGGIPSLHYVKSVAAYDQIYLAGFEREYGPIKNWTILALLPSYLERDGSSLVHMAEGLIQASESDESGFYLYNHQEIKDVLIRLKTEKRPTLLLGVTFALLDFAEKIANDDFGIGSELHFQELHIMETGGMKGRRKELIRPEVHAILRKSFPITALDSEYGMTELLSQAYLKGSDVFKCPPWMRVYTREIADPLDVPKRNGSRGALQIIDLANEHTCSFLALSDQGRVFENGTFEVYGRLDNSEIRGCNLMVSL